ncbi:MAG: amidohydrolase family protein [Alphaproteobacteria bacterium]
MAASTILIAGGRVYDHDGDTDKPATADVLIDGSRIARVAPGLRATPEGRAARVVEAKGKLVVPGFINAHYHSHDVLLKGCFEPTPAEIWFLQGLPPSYPKRSKEEVRARTLLGAAECIRSGITTVQDLLTIAPYDPEHLDVVLDAYEEAGLRSVFALQVGDIGGLDRVPFWRELVPTKYHHLLAGSIDPGRSAEIGDLVAAEYGRLKDRSPRITWALGPTSPDLCSARLLERVGELSRAHGLPIYTHLYESRANAVAARRYFREHGGSQVAFLDSLGLLGPRTSLAHSVWLLPAEIRRLAETGANVVLNAASNMKAKCGVAPIRDYVREGVAIALGCDNCSCTDAQNMFQAMKLFCTLAAVSEPEPGPPTAPDAIRHATVGGARTAGLEGELGRIAPGMKADLAILDLGGLAFVPLNSAARQLVYGESGSSVRGVIVDGRIVMEDGRLTSIDEDELRRSVEVVMETLAKDHKVVLARNAQFYPELLEAWRMCWREEVGINRYIGPHMA